MVSKARLDLPEPLTPVMTTSWLRGILTYKFLRLCCRAPLTMMESAAKACEFMLKTNLNAKFRNNIHLSSHIDAGSVDAEVLLGPCQLFLKLFVLQNYP